MPEGIAGELFIGGDNVTKGYLNNETLTNENIFNLLLKLMKDYTELVI